MITLQKYQQLSAGHFETDSSLHLGNRVLPPDWWCQFSTVSL